MVQRPTQWHTAAANPVAEYSDRLSGTLQRPTRWQNTAADSVILRGFSQHREHIILFLFTDRQFSVFREHTGPFLFTARWFYVTREHSRLFLCTDEFHLHRFQSIDFTVRTSCGRPSGPFRLRLFQGAGTKRKGKPRARGGKDPVASATGRRFPF